MKKLSIAVDYDDVVVPTAELILGLYNQRYGTQLGLEHYYSLDLAAWGVTDSQTAIKQVEAVLETEQYQQAQPFAEAIEVTRELARSHELHIVTGRPDFLEEATKRMLSRYFPDVFRSIEFTNLYWSAYRSKGAVCKQLSIDVLVDDHVGHALAVAACGIEVLLFGDYPWNQVDTLPDRVRRVAGWKQVAELLLAEDLA